jgi:hypothetical protein
MIDVDLPASTRWICAVLAGAALYGLGMLHGERVAGQAHIDYLEAQGAKSVEIIKAQQKVVVQTEIKYRDRIKTVYVKGEEIEKLVPVYVTRADDDRYGVNAGFVRSYNAAWAGEPAGTPAESDRDAAGIPLSEVAEVDAYNATACRAWRELAIGLREHYEGLKAATN